MDLERFLRIVAKHDATMDVFWNEDLQFFINCNDLFWWGTADLEPVETDANIDLLEQSLADTSDWGCELYACRHRKMRPQTPFYRKCLDKKPELIELFNACGPVREPGADS